MAAASVMSEISGTIRLSAGDIEDLYKADLYINVATNADERLLRGRIMPQVRVFFGWRQPDMPCAALCRNN